MGSEGWMVADCNFIEDVRIRMHTTKILFDD